MTLFPLPYRVAGAAIALLLSACATSTVPPAANPVTINLVALNDFHGHLESSKFTYTSVNDKTARTVVAGGIDTLAAALQAWRKEDSQLLLVGAGDLVGATPPMSAMWADEPSIGAMNLFGMRVTSVGNHEFDQGRYELLRQQNGGCNSPRPKQACQFKPTYDGARFTYLAANVIDKATGKPFMPAYRIETAHGVKVGFIGAVLKNTASVVMAAGIAGLDFIDEADAVNRVLPELRAQGVGVFVVLIHQGGRTSEYFDQPDCGALTGEIVGIVQRFDPAIRLVVSGHSHTGYLCRVDGKLVTQADMGGHVMSRIQLSVDTASNSVRAVTASNVVMTPGAYPADPAADAYLAAIRQRSTALLEQPVAKLAVASVGRERTAAGESALGDLVADAMLAAGHAIGSQIAFMNRGGLRADLQTGQGNITMLGQTRIVMPFGNTLVAMHLTGAQIRTLLEQQWGGDKAEERGVLQVSDGFSYRWDASRPQGSRVLDITLHGAALDEATAYRVITNKFLAEGGDNFPMFKNGSKQLDTGISDIVSFNDYLAARARDGKPAGAAAAAGRIVRLK